MLVPRTPHTPRTPAQFLAPPTHTATTKSPSRLDVNAPTFVPSRNLSPLPREDDSGEEYTDLKAHILASFDRSTSSSESGRDSPDVDDPNLTYVRLKMKIADLTSDRQLGYTTATSLVRELRTRLETVKQNYLFDEKDAESRYRIEREKADLLALQVRLRGTTPLISETTTHAKTIKQRPPKLQPQVPASPIAVADIFDEDSEESTGGIFEILDDMPTTETNAQGTTVNIRDMALPKHWSGRTPKILLSETVAKADRYAAITYSILSGASRAKRAAVSIRWEGRKMGEWIMEDIACHDEGQAEQYIATVALHALTFPSTDGFAAGTSAAPGSQTFFRLLPAVFRDLWDELEVARKTSDDAINRAVWAKLRSIVEPKLENCGKVSLFSQCTLRRY